MSDKRYIPSALSCLVIGWLLCTVDSVYFIIFLLRKYDNIWTLDGEYILRWDYIKQYLFQTAGGALLLFAICFLVAGALGIMRQTKTSNECD